MDRLVDAAHIGAIDIATGTLDQSRTGQEGRRLRDARHGLEALQHVVTVRKVIQRRAIQIAMTAEGQQSRQHLIAKAVHDRHGRDQRRDRQGNADIGDDGDDGDPAKDRMVIQAVRAIRAGEELTYDYNLTTDDPLTDEVCELWACRCGAPCCRGVMLDLEVGEAA